MKGGVMLMRRGQVTDRELAMAQEEYRRHLQQIETVAPASWAAHVLRSALQEVTEVRDALNRSAKTIGTLGDRARWKGKAA